MEDADMGEKRTKEIEVSELDQYQEALFELLKRMFGKPIESWTRDMDHYVIIGPNGEMLCSCEDWVFRQGSWTMLYHGKEIKVCRHIAQYLAEKEQ